MNQSLYFSTIPAELRGLTQFVVWKLEERNGQATKVPYNANTGRKASSTNASTWASFDEAMSTFASGDYSGIGFVFANGYCGIDFDKCRDIDTGEVESWALEMIEKLDSYTEVSPSGTGLHVLLKAKLNGEGARKNRIELYDTGRYFTLTGEHLQGTPQSINERQEVVTGLYEAIREVQACKQGVSAVKMPERVFTLDDSRIVELAGKAINAAKFERLWSGSASDYNDDRSRADSALVAILCFYTQDDSQVESLWKQSGLYRAKLERPDYVERTIKAMRGRQTTFYSGNAQKQRGNSGSAPEGKSSGETEEFDAPISDDPQREKYVRQIARNASLVSRCYMIFLRRLGFEKNCLRLLTALTAISKGRLGAFSTKHEWLLKYYQQHNGASSQSTLQRDIRKLLDEQRKLGVALISYKPGKKFFDNGQEVCLGSKFQLHLMRYTLEAISYALDLKTKDQRLDEVLDVAIEKVIADANFQPPQEEIKAPAKKQRKADAKDLEQKISDLQGEWIEQAIAERWTDSQIWEEFQKLQTEFSIRLTERLSGNLTARNTQAAYSSQNDHYRESAFDESPVEQSSENPHLYSSQNDHYRDTAFNESEVAQPGDSEHPYSSQNDHYREFDFEAANRPSGENPPLYSSQNDHYRESMFNKPPNSQQGRKRTLYRGQNRHYREDEFDEPYIQ
jgi:putative DNA primase/helicase